MRLIDADKLYIKFDALPWWNNQDRDEIALQGVVDAPTVDAVCVTRCKDCKHKGWIQEPCHGKSIDYCRVWDCTLQNLESTFCSYGEPRKEECV